MAITTHESADVGVCLMNHYEGELGLLESETRVEYTETDEQLDGANNQEKWIWI